MVCTCMNQDLLNISRVKNFIVFVTEALFFFYFFVKEKKERNKKLHMIRKMKVFDRVTL